MADSRFALSNQNIVEQLKENGKNKNTLKATQTWLNVWQTWATQRKVNPKMEEYEHEQLDKMLQIFYTEIRTKDGCEYEPESLKSMLAALDRYLKEHDYKYSIIRDREFHQSKLVLEGKVKCLRQQGKGKRPNAANALTAEEEKMLWSEQSLGDCSPRVLSQTMWWILTQHFGLRGRQKHHSMEVEDFSFCVDDSGTEYVTFKENPTKKRQGGLNTKHRSVLPKMFATGGQRCPVELLKQYLSRRPQELRDKGPFYLAIIDVMVNNIITDVSYHFSQFCILKSKRDKPVKKTIKKRDFSQFSSEEFNTDLSAIDWDAIIASKTNNIDELFSSFYRKLNSVVNNHAPVKNFIQT